jgi:hypothetical protein
VNGARCNCGLPAERKVSLARQRQRRTRYYCDDCAAVLLPTLLGYGWAVKVDARIDGLVRA